MSPRDTVGMGDMPGTASESFEPPLSMHLAQGGWKLHTLYLSTTVRLSAWLEYPGPDPTYQYN